MAASGILGQLLSELAGAQGVQIPSNVMQKVNVAAGTATPTTLLLNDGLFSYCGGNEIISSLQPEGLLDGWLGTRPSITDPVTWPILSWVGPSGTAADTCDWVRDAACADCPSVEFGKCELMACFGEICFSGQDLNLSNLGVQGCERAPIRFARGPLAGVPIDNDDLYQLALASMVAKIDYERQLIVGNKAGNAFNFDGLQVLINSPIYDVRTNLRCQGEEPIIYDWGTVAMTTTICQILDTIVRRIRHRARSYGGISVGDMALVMTTAMRDALLDFAACGCAPCSNTYVDPIMGRAERARLAASGWGEGAFEVDGIPVPIITNDFIPQTSNVAGSYCSDIYILTRRVGALDVLFAEHQNFAQTLRGVDIQSAANAQVTDGGRFLVYSKNVNQCYNRTMVTKNRLRLVAPWLQGRITNVCAPFYIPPTSDIPCDYLFWAGDPPVQAATIPTLLYAPCGDQATGR